MVCLKTNCISECCKGAAAVECRLRIVMKRISFREILIDLITALAAGATFIVSPGLSVAVANICRDRNIPYYPGCVTPTEIMQALELGITTVKFFPANVYGGLKALKALSAPFPQVKFIPTGGVDRSNIDEFLAFDKIAAIGGSFFVKESLEKMEANA